MYTPVYTKKIITQACLDHELANFAADSQENNCVAHARYMQWIHKVTDYWILQTG